MVYRLFVFLFEDLFKWANKQHHRDKSFIVGISADDRYSLISSAQRYFTSYSGQNTKIKYSILFIR